jgi:arsenate reductase
VIPPAHILDPPSGFGPVVCCLTITPRVLTPQLAQQLDLVVSMGCGDQCPLIPGKRYIDWELEAPKSRPAKEVCM